MKIQLHPTDAIHWHSLVKKLPVRRGDHPKMVELVEDVRARGIDNPLLVCATDNGSETPGHLYLLDGRHRHRAAQLSGLAQVPVILCDEAEAPEKILASFAHRNHHTKGQIAFLAAEVIAEQILPHGGNGSNQHQKKSKDTLSVSLLAKEEICGRFGISMSLYDYARQVRRIFEEDPAYAEKMLPKIFAEVDENPVGLGAVVAGYQGKVSTVDTKVDRFKNITRNCLKAGSTFQHAFAHWESIAPARRSEIRQEWARMLSILPEELRNVRAARKEAE